MRGNNSFYINGNEDSIVNLLWYIVYQIRLLLVTWKNVAWNKLFSPSTSNIWFSFLEMIKFYRSQFELYKIIGVFSTFWSLSWILTSKSSTVTLRKFSRLRSPSKKEICKTKVLEIYWYKNPTDKYTGFEVLQGVKNAS